MEDSLLKLEIDNLSELLRLKTLNNELLDANHNLMIRLIQEHKNQKIPLEPEISALFTRSRQILREIASSTEREHVQDYRRGNRTCFKVLFKLWDII